MDSNSDGILDRRDSAPPCGECTRHRVACLGQTIVGYESAVAGSVDSSCCAQSNIDEQYCGYEALNADALWVSPQFSISPCVS